MWSDFRGSRKNSTPCLNVHTEVLRYLGKKIPWKAISAPSSLRPLRVPVVEQVGFIAHPSEVWKSLAGETNWRVLNSIFRTFSYLKATNQVLLHF